jgi:hypothetical protein
MNIVAHVYLVCWSLPLSCGISPGVVTSSWSTWTVLPGVGLVALIPAGSVLEHHDLCCALVNRHLLHLGNGQFLIKAGLVGNLFPFAHCCSVAMLACPRHLCRDMRARCASVRGAEACSTCILIASSFARMTLLTWELSSLVLGCVSLLSGTTLRCPFDRLGIESTVSTSSWPSLYVMVLIMLASLLSAITALLSSNWRSMELRNVIGFVGCLGASIGRSIGGRDFVLTLTDSCWRQSFQICVNWCMALIPGSVGSNGHLEHGWWRIVCLYQHPSQNRTLSPAVVILPVPLCYSSCKSFPKHCGDKMQMGLLGMN